MPVHDWTRVAVDIFHSFHMGWITHLRDALNGGLLSSEYYALGEQHTEQPMTDVVTSFLPDGDLPTRELGRLTGNEIYRHLRRTLAIRHISGHRLIAMIEIASPANKDRLESVDSFAAKTLDALDLGVHVLLLDLLPPGRHDPRGLHGAVWSQVDETPYDLPEDERLTLAAYTAGPPVEAYVEHVRIGSPLPEMPLFLHRERYIPTPLETTYLTAYRGVPAFWREVLEGRQPAS